jgi:ATP-dependent helicase/DNAse subunit B
MSISLIVGPPNSGRAGEVRRRLLASLDRDPVLVVPTADDAAWFERELCASGEPTLGVAIRTFGWLFEDVASTLGATLAPALTAPQRLALVRASIASTQLARLHRSSERPGFAPALDGLIEELQAALVTPSELAERAGELDDGAAETEIAALYGAYEGLRDQAGRGDPGWVAGAAFGAFRADPAGWGGRPVFIYGFDDLTAAQRALMAEIARASEVTVAVNYADRRSLAAQATLLGELTEHLGAEIDAELPFEPGYTEHGSLRHLDQALFEADPGAVPTDGGVVLLDCAGERGEAEAIGLEIAGLIAAGADPGDIAIALRHPASGRVLAGMLAGYGIPVALEAQAPLDRTAVGRALISLCRAAGPGARADDLLAHLRSDLTMSPGQVDWVEGGGRRGEEGKRDKEAATPDEAVAGWASAPRHLARLRATADDGGALRALAAIARELAEGPHRGSAPLAGSEAPPDSAGALHPLELRAAITAAELLEELATVGELPGCSPPGLADAIEALEGTSIPTWRGPTDGRVRIVSPYRLRAGRARYLFCASLQEGEFPSALPADPLLGDERRSQLGIAALRRRERAEEERYLFHACVSRPTERLYLSWRSCDEDGGALPRSPFVDEVLDLLGDSPAAAEEALVRRRGLEQVVPAPAEAPSERELARALAAGGRDADHRATLEAVQAPDAVAARVLASLESLPDPAELPGPLRVPAVLEALAERDVLSANQLERWLECPYRWFVQRELEPERLEPESDPLWLGGVVHDALEALYREAPGADAIPRTGDVSRWKQRFGELLDGAVGEVRLGPERVAALARARDQVGGFLEDEAASETALRPRADLLERGFGMDDDDDPGALTLGDFDVRGKIDRIDVAPDGRSAVVRDYKTGSSVSGAAKFEDEGSLQVQLYMLAARRLLHLDPIAGLYQPLGAVKDRRPRGLARRDAEHLEGLGLVTRGKDVCDEDAFEKHLAGAEQAARQTGAELRAGEIGRRPLGGACPRYCTFQPICRLERAIGLPTNGDDGETGE